MAYDFTGSAEVDTTPDVVVTVYPHGAVEGYITFEVANADDDGTQALNAFSLEVQAHPAGGWHEVLSAAEFDTNGSVALWSTGNIHTCADDASEGAAVFVGPVAGFRFKAGVAANATTATVRGTYR